MRVRDGRVSDKLKASGWKRKGEERVSARKEESKESNGQEYSIRNVKVQKRKDERKKGVSLNLHLLLMINLLFTE